MTIGSDGTSTTFAGVISGNGSVIKTGIGLLTLSGVNTFGASAATSLDLQQGGINFNASGALGSGNILISGANTAFTASAATTVGNPVILGNNATTVTFGTNVAGTNTLALAGPITWNTGSGVARAIMVDSGSTQTLVRSDHQRRHGQRFHQGRQRPVVAVSGANAGSLFLTGSQGIQFLNGSTQLNTGNDGSLGAAPATVVPDNIVMNGGILSVVTAAVLLNPNRGITLGSSGGFFDTNAVALTVAGVITGSGPLTKNANNNSLILSAGNTYTGATYILVGTLSAQNSLALGTTAGGTLVANGAALELNNGLGGAIFIGAEPLTIIRRRRRRRAEQRGRPEHVRRRHHDCQPGAGATAATARINSSGGFLTLTGNINGTTIRRRRCCSVARRRCRFAG